MSFSTKKAAAYLGVSVSTIYRMEETGTLHPTKTPGGQRRFDNQELDDYKKSSIEISAPQNPSLFRNSYDVAEAEILAIVDKRNKLNDLTGKEWLPETKSFFFQKGLGSAHKEAQIEKMHPAPFSYQDISKLISFFTKKDDIVLDPFGGVGSTAKACELLGRTCTSIELSTKWHELAIKRLDSEVKQGCSNKHHFVNADTVHYLPQLTDNSFDFIITSPPYWSILNKKPDWKVKTRVQNRLDTNYSDDINDLGNILDYNVFLDTLVGKVFIQCSRKLKPDKYMCLVVSDFRNKSQYVSFHSDLISRLNNQLIDNEHVLRLQGTKVLLQNHKSLLPYGYPFAYVENIHHQYVLIFQKKKVDGKKNARI
jgi:excisionase family DNA binding protein